MVYIKNTRESIQTIYFRKCFNILPEYNTYYFSKRKMKEIDETDYDCINGVGKICLHCLNYKNECNCPR